MIHKYSMNGYNIVLDIGSGSVHLMDEQAFEMVSRLDREEAHTVILNTDSIPDYAVSPEKIDDTKCIEIYEEIKELVKNGLLFSPDTPAQAPKSSRVVKAICLHVAHDCNMRCGYCFAGEGGYGGKRTLMSLETGKAAIDFLINSSGNRRNLEVDFFGGEPLLNFDVVKGIVEYARGKQGKEFRFTLTTNGLMLNEDIGAFLNAEMDNVVLSIDGRKEVNDKMRVIKTVSMESQHDEAIMNRHIGAYDTIIPKYIEFVKSRGDKNYYVRGTYTKRNLDFANDVLHLAELGFKKISVEPVVASESESYAITENDLPALKAEYERLLTGMLGNNRFEFFHFNIDLEGGPCASKRLGGCGAGVEYLAITPDGDLYPCHQFVGVPEYKMGDLWTGVINSNMKSRFQSCGVYTKPECTECWCRYYCGGGCAANAYYANGDILQPYNIGCELQKKRVECAIMKKAAKSEALI